MEMWRIPALCEVDPAPFYLKRCWVDEAVMKGTLEVEGI